MEKHRTAPKMLEPTIQLYHVITMLYCYKLYPCYIQLLMHSARRFQFLLARPSKAAASSRDCSDCSEAMETQLLPPRGLLEVMPTLCRSVQRHTTNQQLDHPQGADFESNQRWWVVLPIIYNYNILLSTLITMFGFIPGLLLHSPKFYE